jgi:hypothetical protein
MTRDRKEREGRRARVKMKEEPGRRGESIRSGRARANLSARASAVETSWRHEGRAASRKG